MAEKIILLISLCVCLSGASDKVVFQEQDAVWYTEEFLHVVIDLDFQPIIEECADIAKVVTKMEVSINMVHEDSTRAIRTYFTQVCTVVDHWQTHVIEKRQALVFGAMAVSTVFGMFNSIAIGHLSSHVDSLDTKMKRGFVILKKHETRMASIEQDLKKLNSKFLWEMVYMNDQFQHLSIMQDTMIHLSGLHTHTAAISRAWAALVEGHLSWDLIDPKQWSQIMIKIRAEAIRLGGKVPVDSGLELMQFPTSFEATGPKWRIFVHIPIIQEQVRLYKHTPIPIYLDDKKMEEPRIVTLHADEEFLLVTPDDMLHREISKTELDTRCHKFGRRLVCQDLGVFNRHLTDTCLGSLFGRLDAEALTKCSMKEVKNDWQVITINADTLIVFSKKGRGVDVICKNGTRVNSLVQGTAEIRLEQGCSISSAVFFARRSAEVTLEVHVITHPMWKREDLEAAWDRAMNKTKWVEEETRTLTNPPEAEVEAEATDDMDWLEQQLNPATTQGRNLIVALLSAAAGLAALLIVLVAFLMWRFWKAEPTPSQRAVQVVEE
jgi:hypothetical protein